ncbi:MAG TPA: hypothetical protein VNN80_28655 [Polyangiaceae bacterium]|nr:hypothetical protein [Polyangiaceae bacterium]
MPARVALTGDLPALEAAIAQADREGVIDSSNLEELADAVLRRELASLTGPVEQFPNVGPCVRHVRSVLGDVVESDSAFAAPAAVALIDAGFEPPRPAPEATTALAAIEARQALGADAGVRRRAFMLDGDAGVRRAALSAALESAERADLAALAEAARLDPDLTARSLAVRALARIGGEPAVVVLADLYPGAPAALRREIVYGLSVPATFSAGGQRALEELAAASTDEGAVLAALSLHARSPEDTALAEGTLLRAIEGGAAGARLLALEVAPWGSERVRAAIDAARTHSDPATRVVALLRRVEAGALEPADTAGLEKLATDNVTAVGAVARAALARAGNGSVKTALRADLEAKKAEHRMLAALALLALEDWSGAARALGDDSPAVRRALACRVLAEPGAAGLGGEGGSAPWPEALLPPPASGSLSPAGRSSGAFPELVPLLVTGSSG